jgi:flagellin-like hook-associated protein FlgL
VNGYKMIGNTNVSYGLFEAQMGGTVLSAATLAGTVSTSGPGFNDWALYKTTSAGLVIANNFYYSAATIVEAAAISGAGVSAATALDFANNGITITFTAATNVQGDNAIVAVTVSGSAITGNNVIIDKTGLTSLTTANSAALGIYTITDTGVTINLDDGAGHSQTLANSGAGAYDFGALGISFTLDADYVATDIGNSIFEINVNAGPGGPTVFSGATLAAIGADVSSGSWYLFNTATGGIAIANSATFSTATVTETGTYSGAGLSAATALNFANLGVTMTFTAATDVSGDLSAIANGSGTSLTYVNIAKTGLTSIDVNNADAGTYTFAGSTSTAMTLGNGTITQTVAYTGAGSANFNLLGISFNIGSNYDKDVINGMNFTVTNSGGSGAVFQIGAENNTENRISLSIGNVTTGANGLNLQADQLTSQSGAQTMLDTIDTAVSLVSSKDGEIGASMNRLGYAAANLSTTIENTQAAESVIKDVDMASEMTNFTKNQILQQAGTAMLSQANQAPQLILSLFK